MVAGKYRLIHPLGEGSVSEVYLAQTVQQLGMPKVVALKLEPLPPEVAPEALLEAAQHSARVQHANVVRIHDFGVADGRFFVAMEYVEGCSARSLLDELASSREHMPIKQSLAVAIAMCRGLEAAHGTQVGEIPVPVVHRDLRPSSVLIGRHGAVKLAGFGAIRPRPSPYTAPERAGVAFDARADLFAVGMILHELLTGEAPTSKGRSCAWLLRREVPRSLEAVLVKATQPTPRRRYASAALLRADLVDVSEMIADAPSSGVLGDWVERVRRSHG
jgi:serine/threonine-protein kinase